MGLKELIKRRGLIRGSFTKLYDSMVKDLAQPKDKEDDLKARLDLLETKRDELLSFNAEILELLLADDSEEAHNKLEEETNIDDYTIRFNAMKIKVNKLNDDSLSVISDYSSARSKSVKRHVKLPKLQLKKFNGELLDWLPFWSKFQRIHDDCNISDGDKFDYLIQSIDTKTRAYKLVTGYPPTEENYSKAIDSLKARYGRKDLLVEVYVRELLKLVMNNFKKKVNLIDMYDSLEGQLRSLEVLGVKSDTCSAMLYPLVESCLPEEVLRIWQRTERDFTNINDITLKGKLEDLMKFLKREVEHEQHISLVKNSFTDKYDIAIKDEKHEYVPTAAGLVNTEKSLCVFCKQDHPISSCEEAFKITLDEKKKLLLKVGLCFICLRRGHRMKHCRVQVKCDECQQRHSNVMCPELDKTKNKITTPANENSLANVTSSIVLLQTLIVKIRNDKSHRRIRALIDTGSERSYICQSTAKEMNYSAIGEEELIHCLFGGEQTPPKRHKAFELRIANIEETYFCKFNALDQPTIARSVSSMRTGAWMEELKDMGIKIVEVNDGPIELLIGADVAGKLLTGNKRTLSSGLVALETLLGWTVMGRIMDDTSRESSTMMVTSLFSASPPISDLWSLDVLGIQDPTEKMSRQQIEEQILRQFNESVKHDDDSRYEVKLPWIEGHPPLPSNYDMALQRTKNLVKKLKNEGYYEAYSQVLAEWLSEGVIERVKKDFPDEGHYLPHRHVIKINSATSPIRPVFDASAKMKKSCSLNDCLERGINLIELIPSLLIRFRLQKIGVISDIRRAFLQIRLAEDDKMFFKFLWFNTEGELEVYQHARVVFGVVCSPFLLGAVIQHHLNNELMLIKDKRSDFNLEIIKKLSTSFYVDNCVASVDNEEELQQFIEQAKAVLASGGFDLRSWEYSFDGGEVAPLLGIEWNKQKDTLQLSESNFNHVKDEVITKRLILSKAQKLFDPIGFCSPISLVPKVLLQELWSSKLAWDAPVDDEIKSRFLCWYEKLNALRELSVPRWLTGPIGENSKWSLHTFVDASRQAYAAVIYLRVESSLGVSVRLVQAKNRVAPLLSLTIPRLELLAALIGARLASNVLKELDDIDVTRYYWSDSTTVIAWIQRKDQWGVFVRNRIEQIREMSSPSDWHHVPGNYNPADLPSRGCSVQQLITSQWWIGPEWLYRDPDAWPTDNAEINEGEVSQERIKKVSSTYLNVEQKTDVFSERLNYFSSYNRIVRQVGWCLRFINNLKLGKEEKCAGELTFDELQQAENRLIKVIQEEAFNGVQDSNIRTLVPFMDGDGILKIKTKLTRKDDTDSFRFPIILPSHQEIVNKLIFDKHIKNSHAGVQNLLSILRERFWIVGGRRTLKSAINKCIPCKRFSSKALDTSPVALPLNRVRDAYSFEITGIDYAGPLYLKNGEKVYICLFTCAVYRAVHLELATSLSTQVFLKTFRRFINRRGRPKIVYTDNGTNFVGAENILRDIDWERISSFVDEAPIKWIFSPPSAPWWGGWWERLIRILKNMLRRVLGRACLTYLELYTVLTDCEAVINNRPLTYISNDSEDLIPLTPAMFIRDLQGSGVTDIDTVEHESLNRRMKYRQRLSLELRKRFRSEYLGQLKQKPKRNENRQLSVGEVVIISSDNLKRQEWPLAVVVDLIPGADGEVRLVRLRTKSGLMLRSIKRVHHLEVHSESMDIPIPTMEATESLPTGESDDCALSKTEDRASSETERCTRRGRIIKIPHRFCD